ncbi:hypothetical protein ACFUN7_32465 [Streptomyces sp. NPDC057236]|uniref:hypothetical protein n=1 Tax=Streptomyces sp. NPDC057236 TaxID=3346059 RepID=UPI00363A6C06
MAHARTMVAMVAVLVATVTGCSAGGASDPGAVGRTPAPPSTTAALTAAERSLLYDAEQTLVQQCMRRHGFSLAKVPERPVPEHRDFPYGLDDAAWAGRHGYGSDLQRRAMKLRASDPNRRYARSLDAGRRAEAMDALHGRTPNALSVKLPTGREVSRSDEGCTARAEDELYGDLAAWFRAEAITQALSIARQAKVVADPAYTRAVDRWSICMRGRGLAYPDPAAARARFLDGSAGASWAEERRTALAETKCAASSGLTSTAARLSSRYGDALRAEHSEVFRERDRLAREALPRAWVISD